MIFYNHYLTPLPPLGNSRFFYGSSHRISNKPSPSSARTEKHV